MPASVRSTTSVPSAVVPLFVVPVVTTWSSKNASVSAMVAHGVAVETPVTVVAAAVPEYLNSMRFGMVPVR